MYSFLILPSSESSMQHTFLLYNWSQLLRHWSSKLHWLRKTFFYLIVPWSVLNMFNFVLVFLRHAQNFTGKFLLELDNMKSSEQLEMIQDYLIKD